MRWTCRRKPRQGGSFLPNEIFILGLSAGEIAVYAYLLFAGLPPRKAGKKRWLNQTRPCAAVFGRSEGGVGKQHHPSPRLALLEPCGAVVSESGGRGETQAGENQRYLHLEGNR